MQLGRHNNARVKVKTEKKGVNEGWEMKEMVKRKAKEICQSSSLFFCFMLRDEALQLWNSNHSVGEVGPTQVHTHWKVFTPADALDIPDWKTILQCSFILLHHLPILRSSVMRDSAMKITVVAEKPRGVCSRRKIQVVGNVMYVMLALQTLETCCRTKNQVVFHSCLYQWKTLKLTRLARQKQGSNHRWLR